MHVTRFLHDFLVGFRHPALALTVAAILVLLSPVGQAWAGGICPYDVPAQVDIPAYAGKNPRFSTSSAHATLAATPEPSACTVEGSITTDSAPEATPIRFRLFLPNSSPDLPFMGRLLVLGNGGFSGSLQSLSSIQAALAAGLAVVDTDSGHQGSVRDATWASGAPEERKNFAFQAMHLVTVAAKAIVDAFYTPSMEGDLPTSAYFKGCSSGGREGLIEAQEFPEDFDGIIAGAPAIAPSERFLSGVIPLTQANLPDGYLSPVESRWFGSVLGAPLQSNPVFPAPSRILLLGSLFVGIIPGKLEALSDTVLDLCDGRDGIVDGILDDPRTCPVEEVLDALPKGACPGCFTEAQIEALRLFYKPALAVPGAEDTPFRGPFDVSGIDADFPDGPFVPLGLRDPKSGQRLPTLPEPLQVCSVPPFFLPHSFCPGPDGLANLIPSLPGGTGALPYVESNLRYFVFDTDPLLPVSIEDSYNFTLSFDLDNQADVDLFRARMADREGLNADLSDFRDAGGKLIMYVGWADVGVGPMISLNYYEDVARTIGGNTQDFARLFMIPGMHHCLPYSGTLDPGPVPKDNDILAALISWVETGVPPNSLAGETRVPPFPFARDRITRPICPYPEVARQIDPAGSETEAANFHCVNSTFPVDIDIKPGGSPNCINNNGRGVIPVGILSTTYFDAAQIDPLSVTLDGQPVRVRSKGKPKARMKDLNADGRDDLLVQIEDVAGTYDENSDTGTVAAQTFAGLLIEGTDTICIVPPDCCGLGSELALLLRP